MLEDVEKMQKPPSTKVKNYHEFACLIKNRKRSLRIRILSYAPDHKEKFLDLRWFLNDIGWEQKHAISIPIESLDRFIAVFHDAKEKLLRLQRET